MGDVKTMGARDVLEDFFRNLMGTKKEELADDVALSSLLEDDIDWTELSMRLEERYPEHQETVGQALGLSDGSDTPDYGRATVKTYGELVGFLDGLE